MTVAPLTTAANPVPDQGSTKLIENQVEHDPFWLTIDHLGDFHVVGLITGKVDAQGQLPTDGFQFRSFGALWASDPMLAQGDPTGMTWTVTRVDKDAAKKEITHGDLPQSGATNGSYIPTIDVAFTVSVADPAVPGEGVGATVFTVLHDGDAVMKINLDTGKRIIL